MSPPAAASLPAHQGPLENSVESSVPSLGHVGTLRRGGKSKTWPCLHHMGKQPDAALFIDGVMGLPLCRDRLQSWTQSLVVPLPAPV